MFSLTFKYKKKYLLFLVIPIIIVIIIFVSSINKSKTDVSNFLSSYGFDCEFLEQTDIFIPFEFPTFLCDYNDILKKQGFDLSKYNGKKCVKLRFIINNYKPDTFADVILFGGKVIGGDIHIREISQKPLPFNILSS